MFWNIPIQILTIKCTGTPKIGSSEKIKAKQENICQNIELYRIQNANSFKY